MSLHEVVGDLALVASGLDYGNPDVKERWEIHENIVHSVLLAQKDGVEKVNKDVISFLFKGELPQENQEQIQEARQTRPKEKLSEQKEEIPNMDERAAQARAAGNTQPQQQQVTETITREKPKIGRNDKVTIKHVMSGENKTVKYKQAIPLIEKGEWVLIED